MSTDTERLNFLIDTQSCLHLSIFTSRYVVYSATGNELASSEDAREAIDEAKAIYDKLCGK